jgi:hypothetical protein
MRKIVAVRDDRRNGSTARDDLEISKLHFERPPFELGCPQTRNAAKPCLSAARSNVTIHGETVLAKFFDRNGPRGWGPDIDLPEQAMRLGAGTILEIEAILPPDAVVRPAASVGLRLVWDAFTRGTLFDGRVHNDYRRARSPRPLTCCLDGERIASLMSSLRSVLEGRHVDLFQLAV